MTPSRASVSKGVSEAVGSSKITTRCSTSSARAIWTIWRCAIDSRDTGRRGSRSTPSARTAAAARRSMARSSTSGPRRSSRPMKMLRATDRSGARRISWCTRTMPRRSASTGPARRNGLAAQRHRAGRRSEVARQDLHQGRLAGTVLADDGVHLTRRQGQRHVAQHLDGAEPHRQAPRLEHRFRRIRRDPGQRPDPAQRLLPPETPRADRPRSSSRLRPSCICLTRW